MAAAANEDPPVCTVAIEKYLKQLEKANTRPSLNDFKRKIHKIVKGYGGGVCNSIMPKALETCNKLYEKNIKLTKNYNRNESGGLSCGIYVGGRRITRKRKLSKKNRKTVSRDP